MFRVSQKLLAKARKKSQWKKILVYFSSALPRSVSQSTELFRSPRRGSLSLLLRLSFRFLFPFISSQLVISLVGLRILEEGLSKTPFSLADLDDHEKLVSILPEFKLGSGSMVTKILEGYGPVGPDGKKELKLRDAKKGCTLRHLLTHTNGQAYLWNQPKYLELIKPTEGKPHFTDMLGVEMKDFFLPGICEPGERYIYGVGADWLGQFAIRSTGRNLRELSQALVFHPLGLKNDEIDLIPIEKMAGIHVRGGEKGSFVDIGFQIYGPQDRWNPEEGKAWVATGPVMSSWEAYS